MSANYIEILDYQSSFVGSFEYKKLLEALMGKDGKNLDQLHRMDGECFISVVISKYFYPLEFVHTSDIESLNSLLLKYCKKRYVYR